MGETEPSSSLRKRQQLCERGERMGGVAVVGTTK